MKFLKIIKKLGVYLLLDVFLISFSVAFANAEAIHHGELAFAEESTLESTEGSVSYPYTQYFTITAYYSPLPCQDKYVTGSYESDIRLNGSGVRGADGTSVYPGMIAAPKIYPFGTKMEIAGVGIVAVHDRGGAILASNGQDGVYDRLDIWMGYGDKGLTRALNWGKRTLEVVVYGLNDSIAEQIILSDYSNDEAVANDCSFIVEETVPQVEESDSIQPDAETPVPESTEKFSVTLQFGNSGNEVFLLQEELEKINYYKGEKTGIYDELTEHAVFKFQQGQGILTDKENPGAGILGPKTRERLNEIVGSRDYTTALIAQATAMAVTTVDLEKIEADPSLSEEVVAMETDFAFSDGFESKSPLLISELSPGTSGPDIEILQQFLKDHGYFDASFVTDYFGEMTYDAVVKFQLDNEIISTENDEGAGQVGPETLKLINALS